MSWIVGMRTAGDRASKRRCLVPLSEVVIIEEGALPGGAVIHVAHGLPWVLVAPSFEEIVAELPAGWIVGRAVADAASNRGIALPMARIRGILRSDQGNAIVSVEDRDRVLVEPTFGEIEERLMAPRPWRVDEVRASMAADRERAEREGQGS